MSVPNLGLDAHPLVDPPFVLEQRLEVRPVSAPIDLDLLIDTGC
jgi:hypothetical protein